MTIYTKRIRDLREDNDLKQITVAKYLNISQTYYSKYELGKVPIPLDNFIKLCEFYNISADYLLGFSDEPRAIR